MTSTPDSEAERADEEAVGWVIALREDSSDPDLRERFEAWLAASPANARAWSETAHIYERIGDAPPAFVVPGANAKRRVLPPARRAAVQRGSVRPDASRPVRRRAALGAIAAALVAFIAAPSVMLRIKADYVTGTAELRTVTLADGSKVRLAPATAVSIDYSRRDRHVTLLRGGAWFDVTHNAARPFHVSAKGAETTVLGTAFEVRLEDDGAAVAVERGRVRVDYAKGDPPLSAQLGVGDAIYLSWSGPAVQETLPPEQVASWRRGQLVVHNRPVADVIDEIRAYYPGLIITRGDGIARRRVTGVFDLADPVAALQAVGRAHGGSIIRLTPWILVISEG